MIQKEEVVAAMELFEKNRPEKALGHINQTRMGVWAVIEYLHTVEQPVTSKEISDTMKVSSARMTVLLKKMEREGLLKKEHSTTDARSILVSLTEKGYEKAVDIERRRYACMEEILEEYTLQELELLFQQLGKIHSIFQKALKTHEKEEYNP